VSASPEKQPESAELRRLRARFRKLIGLIALALLLTLAWAFSPLREALDPARVVGFLRQQGAALGLPGGIALFALASMCAVPLTFLTIVAVIAYEPLSAYLCCIIGGCVGGACSHRLGAWLGAGFVRKLAGPSVQRVSERLGRRGVTAVIIIRLLPLAPFAIVNMLIGASHISLRDLIVGTWLGMTPGIVLLVIFFDRLTAWLGY